MEKLVDLMVGIFGQEVMIAASISVVYYCIGWIVIKRWIPDFSQRRTAKFILKWSMIALLFILVVALNVWRRE